MKRSNLCRVEEFLKKPVSVFRVQLCNARNLNHIGSNPVHNQLEAKESPRQRKTCKFKLWLGRTKDHRNDLMWWYILHTTPDYPNFFCDFASSLSFFLSLLICFLISFLVESADLPQYIEPSELGSNKGPEVNSLWTRDEYHWENQNPLNGVLP